MATLVSQSEQKFVEVGVEQNIRNDGRSRLDSRPISIDSEQIPQAFGSSKVALCQRMDGGGLTDVLVVIKGEVVAPHSDHPGEGFIDVSVNCSSSLYANTSDRRNICEELTSDLSFALQRMLSSFPLDSLCVMKGRFCWRLYADVFISNDDGNLLDVASYALWIALNRTKLPRLKAVAAQAGFQDDFFLDSEPTSTITLKVDQVPIFITFNHIGNHFIIDATKHEENCRTGLVSIAVNPSGNFCGTYQDGRVTCNQQALIELMGHAQSSAFALFHGLEAAREEGTNKSTPTI